MLQAPLCCTAAAGSAGTRVSWRQHAHFGGEGGGGAVALTAETYTLLVEQRWQLRAAAKGRDVARCSCMDGDFLDVSRSS